jgi:hypothetical protein
MSQHNAKTSRHYLARWENQKNITKHSDKQIELLEARRDELKKAVAGVYNIASLNHQIPSKSNMDDIINLLDSVIHQD